MENRKNVTCIVVGKTVPEETKLLDLGVKRSGHIDAQKSVLAVKIEVEHDRRKVIHVVNCIKIDHTAVMGPVRLIFVDTFNDLLAFRYFLHSLKREKVRVGIHDRERLGHEGFLDFHAYTIQKPA